MGALMRGIFPLMMRPTSKAHLRALNITLLFALLGCAALPTHEDHEVTPDLVVEETAVEETKAGDGPVVEKADHGHAHSPTSMMGSGMMAAMMSNRYPHPRRPVAITKLGLEGKPTVRVNSVSKKKERQYTVNFKQTRMRLYKELEQNGFITADPKRSTPLYDYYARSSSSKDMFCMTREYDISALPPTQLVAFHPFVTHLAGITFDDDIVHHMDLFLCTDETDEYPVETKEVPTMGAGTQCDSMPWAYDRDAKALVLPDHVGVSIGKGTPYTRIRYEWHYLLNKEGQLQLPKNQDKFEDHSGVRLVLTPDLRRFSTGTFGMMNMNMKLPPGKARYDYVMTTNEGSVEKMLQHDLNKFGYVKPVAVHLHMHDHGRGAYWEHRRQGKKIGTYGQIAPYKGYGTDESFFMVDPAQTKATAQEQKEGHLHWSYANNAFKKGDNLRMHCVFDTRCKYATPLNDRNCERASKPIEYGLSHGDEMCGFLMMYYPHDPTVRMKNGMLLGMGSKDFKEGATGRVPWRARDLPQNLFSNRFFRAEEIAEENEFEGV